MINKHKVTLYATSFAVLFTALTYVIPSYSLLWLSLEVAILPAIYATFYEAMMDRQKKEFDNDLAYIQKELIKTKIERDKFIEISEKRNKYKYTGGYNS